MSTDERHGAVHAAIRNKDYDEVKRLLEDNPVAAEEYVDLKSPLYLAAELGYREIIHLILTIPGITPWPLCTAEAKNPLHAAALGNFGDCINQLLVDLDMSFDAAKEADIPGWTALHYAAQSGYTEAVEVLLSAHKSLAYVAGLKADSETALHLAVMGGHLPVVEKMIRHSPDCLELSTDRHKNALHLAVENERQDVLDFLLETPLARELINRKDENGNTPLHLYAATRTLDGYHLLNHPWVNTNVSNNAYKTPLDMALVLALPAHQLTERQISIGDELRGAGAIPGLEEVTRNYNKASFQTDSHSQYILTRPLLKVNDRIKELKKMGGQDTAESDFRKIRSVVATLIITVTFAAGLSVPGGFDDTKGEVGMAILYKRKALTAFVVTNSLALIFATYELIDIIFYDDYPETITSVDEGSYLVLAMPLMEIAFSTGLYVTLQETGLKIYALVIGSVIAIGTYLALGNSLFKISSGYFY